MATWTYTIGDGYYYNHMSLQQNAENVKAYLETKGYSRAAIIGVIANMDHESYLNPAQQEHDKGGSVKYGYGLVQWTPADKKILAYATSVGGIWYDGDLQMQYTDTSFPSGWIKSTAYPYSLSDYKQLTDIYEAARTFFWNFERGTWHDVIDTYAEFWDNQLYGSAPPLPPYPPSPSPYPYEPTPSEDDFYYIIYEFLAKLLR